MKACRLRPGSPSAGPQGQPKDQIRDQAVSYLDANPPVRVQLPEHPATLGRTLPVGRRYFSAAPPEGGFLSLSAFFGEALARLVSCFGGVESSLAARDVGDDVLRVPVVGSYR